MGIETDRISAHQAVFLVTNLIFATEIEFVPTFLARYAGQDAWVAVLLTAVAGLFLGILVVSLGLRFPGKNLVELGMELLGPVGGRILGMLLGFYLLWLSGVAIREFGDHLVTAAMPETPLVVFSLLMVSLVVYGVYLGLEVIARAGEIIYPLFLLALLLGALLAIPQLNWDFLKPVLVHSPVELLRASGNLLAFYGEGFVFLMFLPYLRRPQEGKRVSWLVILLLNLPLLLLVLFQLAAFSPEETTRMVFPTLELMKIIRIGGLLDRVESFHLSFWILTVALKVMVLYYAALLAFAQSLGLRDYRPLVLPGAFWLVALSLLVFSDVTHARTFLATTFTVFALAVEAGIPIILYILALVMKKGKTPEGGPTGEKTG